MKHIILDAVPVNTKVNQVESRLQDFIRVIMIARGGGVSQTIRDCEQAE